MINVLFDYQHFSEQRYGGITRYFANIMQAINARADIEYTLSALHSNNYYIRNEPLPFNNSLGDKFFAHKLKREIKWNQLYSKYCLQKGNYDIFHPTYYNPYYLNYVKKPVVLTVHDMIHERFTNTFLADDVVAAQKKQSVLRADKIIAISQSTKNDLVALLNVPEAKIEVVYHGVETRDFPTKPLQLTLDIPPAFVLYVGDRNAYKNFNRFAEALAGVFDTHKELYLICTGGLPFSKEEVLMLTRLNIIHRCIRINATDNQLQELYQNARMFVFPSLLEGFGFPILEAFQNCCPVLCSHTGSFPEVGGNAAVYFNPTDIRDMAMAMQHVLSDTPLRNRLINAGKRRLMDFPIKKSVDETIAVYKQLV